MLDKQQLITYINNRVDKQDICKLHNISYYKLNRLLDSYNLTYAGNKELSYPQFNKEWMIQNWVNTTKSLKQLADEYGVKESVLDRARSRYKLSKHYKYHINSKIFDLTDPHLYYLAGLVATDGYVPRSKNAIEICLLGESELQLLRSINNYYSEDNLISVYNNKPRIRLSVEGLNDFLCKNFGIHDGAKTFDVDVPSYFYNEECVKAYINGCIDGDGSLRRTRISVSLLMASEQFVSKLANLITQYTGEIVKVERQRGFYSFTIRRKHAIKVLDWMYSLKDCFRLERKYNIYKSYKSIVNDIV